MADYIERESVKTALWNVLYSFEDENEKLFIADPELDVTEWFFHRIFVQSYHANALQAVLDTPAADVRPVIVCANCEHNNHCLTQEFVDDCGKIPLDRNTFFCADGERRNNA